MLTSADIDRFFAAAISPQAWPAALEALAERMDADGITLVAGTSFNSHIVCSSSLTALVAEYRDVGARIDSREVRVQPTLATGFLGDLDHYSADEIERDPFYLDFLRPRGLGWHAAAQLAGGTRPVLLSLKRQWRRGPFQPRELRNLSRALPALRSAARMAEIALTARRSDCLDMLAERGLGGVLLDGEGRVLMHNAEMPRTDGVSIVGGRLVAASGSGQAALDRLVASLTMRGADDDPNLYGPILLHRPSGASPYVVRGNRLTDFSLPFSAGARALLSIADPARRVLPAAPTLGTLFKLTPREADLAIALADGLSLKEAARSLNISVAHARQRLKVVFEKTGTKRQVELTELVARLG